MGKDSRTLRRSFSAEAFQPVKWFQKSPFLNFDPLTYGPVYLIWRNEAKPFLQTRFLSSLHPMSQSLCHIPVKILYQSLISVLILIALSSSVPIPGLIPDSLSYTITIFQFICILLSSNGLLTSVLLFILNLKTCTIF